MIVWQGDTEPTNALPGEEWHSPDGKKVKTDEGWANMDEYSQWAIQCKLPDCGFIYDASLEALSVILLASPFDAYASVFNRVMMKAAPILNQHLDDAHPDYQGPR